MFFSIGTGDDESSATEKVGIIEITGMIADSKDVIRKIKKFREDETVKAIVLRINSPGGAVSPSQEIYREVRKTIEKKKVIVSMATLAASGGYYIAAAADGIVANKGTITGSIGVIMSYTNFREIFEKIGLVPVVFKSGQFKDMGSPVRKMTESEKTLLQELVNSIHQQFVKDVADGRNMDIVKISALADGRIFTGEQAKELELVDRIGNLEDAVAWAGQLGGIKGKVKRVYAEDEPIPFLHYLFESGIKNIFEQLMTMSMKADAVADSSIASDRPF